MFEEECAWVHRIVTRNVKRDFWLEEGRRYASEGSEHEEVSMMRIGGIVLTAVLAVALASIGASGNEEADRMFDGAHTYYVSCRGCHGVGGEGVSLFGVPLAGDAFIKSSDPSAIAMVINQGRKYREKLYKAYMGMPAFQYITGGELEALVDYLKGPLQGGAPAAK